MSKQHKRTRPPLPQRYSRFLELSAMNELIELLTVAYEETKNEKVWRVLNTLQKVKANEVMLEDAYREEELQEFWDNPGAFPEAVRFWFFQYRDQELQ